MGTNEQDAINGRVESWINELKKSGLDLSYPMAPFNEFAVTTSSFQFGRRVQGLSSASKNHDAIDMSIITRQHLSKYPELRAKLDEILVDFPGLKPKLDAQLAKYGLPADIKEVPVKALVSGRILYVGKWNEPSGYTVMIGGDNGKIYSYAHLENNITVDVGQRVTRGDTIATFGKVSGRANAPCVHVVERQLPFSARPGEKPDYDRWTFLHRTGSHKDRVSAADFTAALAGLELPALTINSLKKVPVRFLFTENPTEGTPNRPSLDTDTAPRTALASKPKAKPKTPHEDTRGWGEYICDGLAWAVGFGDYACSVNPPNAKPKEPRRR